MDGELFVALLVFWLSTTAALICFMSMWFFNEGESFHPHSVDIDHRHSLFVVVHSNTCCKLDCCVKSISAFVAPRGSSSSKQFTVLCAMISVAGFLGTYRWHKVGDGGFVETLLSLAGFACLLLVAIFELDVVPERFLEDKLMVTGWLIQKLKMEKLLDFKLSDQQSFLTFIRSSKDIYDLYEEDFYLRNRSASFTKFQTKNDIWGSLHISGAIGYVILVTAAILVNDENEQKVAWITGLTFFFFSFLGYLTGTYLPVLRMFRGWIILWNPFLRDPLFMWHLQKAVQEYNQSMQQTNGSKNGFKSTSSNVISPSQSVSSGSSKRKSNKLRHRKKHNIALTNGTATDNNYNNGYGNNCREQTDKLFSSLSTAPNLLLDDKQFPTQEQQDYANKALDNIALRFAHRHPHTYLTITGHLLVMSELVALLTPAVAMGIQWATALCDEPPVQAMVDFVYLAFQCAFHECTLSQHCILKNKK